MNRFPSGVIALKDKFSIIKQREPKKIVRSFVEQWKHDWANSKLQKQTDGKKQDQSDLYLETKKFNSTGNFWSSRRKDKYPSTRFKRYS